MHISKKIVHRRALRFPLRVQFGSVPPRQQDYEWHGGVNQDEMTSEQKSPVLSDGGREYLENLAAQAALDMTEEEKAEFTEIVTDQVNIYPAESGYFSVEGYMLQGANNSAPYEIKFTDNGQTTLLWSEKNDCGMTGIPAVCCDDTLYFLWDSGVLYSLSDDGDLSYLFDARPENRGAELSCLETEISGSESELSVNMTFDYFSYMDSAHYAKNDSFKYDISRQSVTERTTGNFEER